MGAEAGVSQHRVVFDTTTAFSAVFFRGGSLSWLREHWRSGLCIPLVSAATAAELIRVLGYPKFQLSQAYQEEVLGEYLPYCEVVEVRGACPIVCRDRKDQPFLDLAHRGKANLLVSGDQDLLALAGKTPFAIESPAAYRRRIFADE